MGSRVLHIIGEGHMAATNSASAEVSLRRVKHVALEAIDIPCMQPSTEGQWIYFSETETTAGGVVVVLYGAMLPDGSFTRGELVRLLAMAMNSAHALVSPLTGQEDITKKPRNYYTVTASLQGVPRIGVTSDDVAPWTMHCPNWLVDVNVIGLEWRVGSSGSVSLTVSSSSPHGIRVGDVIPFLPVMRQGAAIRGLRVTEVGGSRVLCDAMLGGLPWTTDTTLTGLVGVRLRTMAMLNNAWWILCGFRGYDTSDGWVEVMGSRDAIDGTELFLSNCVFLDGVVPPKVDIRRRDGTIIHNVLPVRPNSGDLILRNVAAVPTINDAVAMRVASSINGRTQYMNTASFDMSLRQRLVLVHCVVNGNDQLGDIIVAGRQHERRYLARVQLKQGVGYVTFTRERDHQWRYTLSTPIDRVGSVTVRLYDMYGDPVTLSGYVWSCALRVECDKIE